MSRQISWPLIENNIIQVVVVVVVVVGSPPPTCNFNMSGQNDKVLA